ncbi:MAG: elongator complex protein 3 [Desulfotignum sp.]
MTVSPLVIPIFIPHSGCPHQCAFCDQKAITGESSVLPDALRVAEIIGRYLGQASRRTRVEVAFFGGNFLGLATGQILALMESVRPFLDSGTVHGIRFSTRPDTVTRERLALIEPFPVCLVELGVQTMADPVLKKVNRGHTRGDTLRAMVLLREQGLAAGVQIMAGLPGDTSDGLVSTAQILSALKPLTARIYPVLVLKNTLLARWYQDGTYQPLDLDSAVDLTCQAYRIFTRAGVTVIRMGLLTSQMDDQAVLAGPRHPAFGHLVLCRDMYLKALEKITDLGAGPESGKITLQVHPFQMSRMHGDKNGNLLQLKAAFPGYAFHVAPDPATAPDQVKILRSPA